MSQLAAIAQKANTTIRVIYDYNPTALPFALPPQLSKGLQTAQEVSDTLGLNIRVPTAEELETEALGRYQELLGNLRRPAENTLKSALGGTQSAVEILKSIDWLIG
jgi:hypothetical protein